MVAKKNASGNVKKRIVYIKKSGKSDIKANRNVDCTNEQWAMSIGLSIPSYGGWMVQAIHLLSSIAAILFFSRLLFDLIHKQTGKEGGNGCKSRDAKVLTKLIEDQDTNTEND